MIDRKIGLVYVPSKTGDIIEIGKDAKVKILNDHAIDCVTYKKVGRRRPVIDNVTLHFCEEINFPDQPWTNTLRFTRTKTTRRDKHPIIPH